MSLQPGQELTPEEVLALKQDVAATNAAVFSATNMGGAMMQGAPEYTPEEIVEMKAATARAELTPEQVLTDKVSRLYDTSAPDPTIDEWRAGTRAEKALQEAGEIDSNFVAAAKGIGGLVVTLAEGATSALRYDPRDAEGNVIPATGALDYISRYNPATMPLAMTDAALRLPATLNYAGELMEQNYATLDAGVRAISGPKYRVKETGEFVLADQIDNTLEARRGVSPPDAVAQYAAKGLTLVPVTEQDREEFDYQQFLGNRARMRSIEQKRTEEVGAEPLTAAALSLGAAPLDAITGSNYMEQIWKDKLPAESQAMTLQVAADPMNWASLGAGTTRLGISAAAKGAGAKFLNAIGKSAQAMSRPTEASIKQVKNFQNAVWPAGRVALYAGGLAGLNYSSLPEPIKNGMNVAAAAYVLYRGGGAVLRWTGDKFPTASIMLRESADPLGGADKIARHMVANNPKIPASIRERVARPSQFVSMESTPARLARNEALSPRTRKMMDKLSNVYVVQGVRTASDLTTGAIKGGIVAAPFAEATRAAGDEKGADITYGAGIAFGAAGGLANRVAGARNRRVAQAESDIGRMLVDIQASGPELQKSGGLKRYEWFDRELNRFLTDVELAGGDIGHMFDTRSFDEIARTAAMQGLFRNVDYVPLNGADFALNAKAAGQDGAAGFFLQAPEGGRPRIFINLDARRADVEAHEFGEALFSSGAFSPEQMADMRTAIDKRYGPQGLEARAREYAEQMIKAGNARNFPGENLVVSDEQIRSMMDELSQAELQRGGTDAMDWIRREMMVEEWRMAGLDYAAIRRNVPQGANPLTFAENILGANARALGLSGVKIDPETGLAAKPEQLFKDNPVAADDPIVNRNLRQYIKAHQQWMNDPAHEVPSGVKIAPDGRAESLLNNPNVAFDANGQNPIATRDPLTGQIRWKSDKDRAKEAKLRGQQIRNVAGRNLLEQSNPQFGPKKTANGRIRISGRRLPASLELQNHWKPQLDKIRRIEALSDAAESQQVLYVAMGASADKVKTSRPQDIVAINREVVFDEWVVQGKNNDLYAQLLDLTTVRNRAMKAIAARNPALDPANGGPGYSLKAIMDDVFQWMDDKRAGKAGEATIGQDRKNIVNALINPGTSMNRGKNPLAGSFGRGSAIKTLLVENIMAVSGTGRKGVAMDYNWANGNFMPDQPAPRPDVDSDLRMPQALPREAMGMPDAPANLTTDQILRELEENQGYLGLSTLGMREGRPVKGGAQQTRELLKRNTALNEELRRRGGMQEESDVERVLRQRGQATPDAELQRQGFSVKGYHGGRAGYSELNTPAFVASSPDFAKWYAGERGDGTVYDVRINPSKMLDLTKDPRGATLQWLKSMQKDGIKLKLSGDTRNDGAGAWSFESDLIRRNSPYDGGNALDMVYAPEVQQWLRKNGYDGVHAFDTLENTEAPVYALVNKDAARLVQGDATGRTRGQAMPDVSPTLENFDAAQQATGGTLRPIADQPENAPIAGRLTPEQSASIDELQEYYRSVTPQRVKELQADAVESLASRLINKGIPVTEANDMAKATFRTLRSRVNGAMQVISGMGTSDLSRMAGTGRPAVATRKGVNPNWLTSAFEAFDTDNDLALMKAQQVARQLNKEQQAQVAAGQSVDAARASGVRSATIDQGMQFVIGEKTADQKAFGSSLREDPSAPPRVYASVVEGQKFGSQGNYNVFFEWKKDAPMVVTSHHHYGVGNGLTDIHASANIGDKNARSFGDPQSEVYDTLPSGKKVLRTRLLVGNAGAADIRAHQLMVSIPESALSGIKKKGAAGARAELNRIAISQLVGSASQGKTQSFTSKDGVAPMVAIQRNRTEAYVLNPDLKNVASITIVSNSPKETALIKKNLASAFKNNGSPLPRIKVVSAESGPSGNPGRKKITDEFFNLTGKVVYGAALGGAAALAAEESQQ